MLAICGSQASSTKIQVPLLKEESYILSYEKQYE